jgi:hypothetical protein
MSFLPDINEDGTLKDFDVVPRQYKPPRTYNLKREEENLAELNNLNRKVVSEDFSDSPALER